MKNPDLSFPVRVWLPPSDTTNSAAACLAAPLTMVKIASKKTKSKVSPLLVIVALGTLGTILYLSNGIQPDDSRVGSLLNFDFDTSPVYNAVSDSVSSVSSVVASAGGVTIPSVSDTRKESLPYVPSSTSGLQPIRCQELFQLGYRQDSKDTAQEKELNPNNDQVHARYTQNLTSPFWISVHHEKFDKEQYDSIMLDGVYNKTALSQAAVEILGQASRSARVLDVGAQVGWFTLLARGMGFEVDAFEPLRPNLFRLCESLFLNKWSNFVEQTYPGPFVNIHGVAVSDQTSDSFLMSQRGANALTTGDKEIKTSSISLDEFAKGRGWINEDIALLKINTGGMEDNILTGAKDLLASKMVKNVLLGLYNPNSTKACTVLLEAGYAVHMWGYSLGPDQDAAALPKEGLVDALREKVSNRDDKQMFLWFKV
jgi:FkbM family methyltransferase